MKKTWMDRKVISWAMYDWANSAFTTSVITVFFPIFFKKYWAQGATAAESTFYLGLSNSIAGLLIAILAPILGALADQGLGRKNFLVAFMALGVLSTCGFYFVDQGQWLIAILIFVMASLGFTGSITFYDSLIVEVTSDEKADMVSALGFGFGYLGGGLLLVVNALMATKPEWFGITDRILAVKLIFVSVALWWIVFSLPILFWVQDRKTKIDVDLWTLLGRSFQDLGATIKSIFAHKTLLTFLLAYFFYMDGVATIIKMAVSYGKDIGISDAELIQAVIVVQFVGFPAAILFGKIGETIGTKWGILAGLLIYSVITIWGAFITQPWEFFAIAGLIGLVQGGVQSLSRSAYLRLIPQEKAAEYFGFYSLFSKFSSILGPLLMGYVALWTGNPRFSIVAVMILFLIGGTLLWQVPHQRLARSQSAK